MYYAPFGSRFLATTLIGRPGNKVSTPGKGAYTKVLHSNMPYNSQLGVLIESSTPPVYVYAHS